VRPKVNCARDFNLMSPRVAAAMGEGAVAVAVVNQYLANAVKRPPSGRGDQHSS
jgi:hypothetical protein